MAKFCIAVNEIVLDRFLLHSDHQTSKLSYCFKKILSFIWLVNRCASKMDAGQGVY